MLMVHAAHEVLLLSPRGPVIPQRNNLPLPTLMAKLERSLGPSTIHFSGIGALSTIPCRPAPVTPAAARRL
jgi:hypothetical protein